MDDGEKTEPKTAKKRRARGKPFKAGEPSANPNGRPKGSKNRVTIVAEALIDGQSEQVIQKIVELALAGDTSMLRWLGDRIVAPRKDRHVTCELPAVASVEDALTASRLVIAAVADGRLTPSEGAELAKALEVHIRLYTTVELEQGLATLEQQQGRMVAS